MLRNVIWIEFLIWRWFIRNIFSLIDQYHKVSTPKRTEINPECLISLITVKNTPTFV